LADTKFQVPIVSIAFNSSFIVFCYKGSKKASQKGVRFMKVGSVEKKLKSCVMG